MDSYACALPSIYRSGHTRPSHLRRLSGAAPRISSAVWSLDNCRFRNVSPHLSYTINLYIYIKLPYDWMKQVRYCPKQKLFQLLLQYTTPCSCTIYAWKIGSSVQSMLLFQFGGFCDVFLTFSCQRCDMFCTSTSKNYSCCELAVRVVETGAGAGAAGAGAGPVSWLRVRWRQIAGAGAGCQCGCCELAVHVVVDWCWCRAPVLFVLVVCVVQIGCWCRVLALAVRVVETRHAVLRVKIGAAANAGCSPEKSFACFCYLWSMLPHRRPAPSTSTSNLSPPRAQPAHSTSARHHQRHPAPSTSNLFPPRAQQHQHRPQHQHTSSQHQHRHPAPAPATLSTTCTASSQPAHSTSTSTRHHQHQHRRPAPSTSNLSPPRAQPAHSTSVHSQLTAPAPAPGTSTSNLSRKRARATHVI